MDVFEKANIYQTRGINDVAEECPTFKKEIIGALLKFMKQDWGDSPDEDKVLNDQALEYKDRVLAAYQTSKGKIWIIAESNDGEEYTSILMLFPDEY